MGDELSKLRPDRDLQCYFYEPSAIAAFSSTGPDGFTVSGCWRQQFDWAVVEWNRDNVFEHPALRNLPDGDLSGVRLSYRETRTNCIPIDSRLYPTVDWPYLRVWADVNGKETIYRVPILEHATSLTGSSPATGQFELQGSITAGDYIELSWLDQHFNYAVSATDTLESAAAALATIISANRASGLILATAKGAVISLTYLGMPGSNGNRVGAYGTVQGAGTERWAPEAVTFSGGVTAPTWQIDLDFSDLRDENGVKIPTGSIRKLRWTWAADLQPQAYQRSEFSVVISNWTVSGDNLSYKVAGPGSRRIENVDDCIAYSGTWKEERGNYSGGSIHRSTEEGASISCSYIAGAAHNLYLGTRYLENGAELAIEVDGEPSSVSLALHGEDVLARVPLGLLAAGEHSVSVTHTGAEGSALYFDFLELAIPGPAAHVCRHTQDDAGHRLGYGALTGDRSGEDGVAARSTRF